MPNNAALHDNATLRNMLVESLESQDVRRAKRIWSVLALATSEIPALVEELLSLLFPPEPPTLSNWDDLALEVLNNSEGCRRVRNIVGVLSSATVLGYLAVCDYNVTASMTGIANALLQVEGRRGLGPVIEHEPLGIDNLRLLSTTSFCVAVGSLGSLPFKAVCGLLSSRLAHLLRDEGAYPPRDFRGCQIIGLLSAACVVWTVRSSILVTLRNSLPDPSKLPFLNVLGRGDHVPLPDGNPDYSSIYLGSTHPSDALDCFGFRTGWSLWLRNNVDALVADMARGEWVGYYTNSIGTDYSNVDAMLVNIFFTTTADAENTDVVHLETGLGADGVGTFSLAGTLSRSTGAVRLTKQYFGTETHSWDLNLALTPLGLAGCWGTGGSAMGYSWMYKREWARPEAFTHTGNRYGPPHWPSWGQ